MIGYKKEEGIAFIVLGPFSFEIARRQQEEIDCISEKAKSLPGFESGSLRQNAIALSLAPSPPPLASLEVKSQICLEVKKEQQKQISSSQKKKKLVSNLSNFN